MAVMQVSFGVYMGIVACVKRSVGTRGRAPLSGKPRELPRVSSAHQPPRNTTSLGRLCPNCLFGADWKYWRKQPTNLVHKAPT